MAGEEDREVHCGGMERVTGVGMGVSGACVVCIPPLAVSADAVDLPDLYAADALLLALLGEIDAPLPSLPADTASPLAALHVV